MRRLIRFALCLPLLLPSLRLFAQPPAQREPDSAARMAKIEELTQSVNRLVDVLHDEDPAVRRQAALALGSLGLDLQASVGPLTKRLEDRDPLVRLASIRALLLLHGTSSVYPLSRAIFDADPRVQVEAMLAVEALHDHKTKRVRVETEPNDPFNGGYVMEIVPPDFYEELSKSSDSPAARGMLAIAFRQPSPDIEAAVPVVLRVAGQWDKGTSGDSEGDRLDEYNALGAVPATALAGAVGHKEPAVRRTAVRALFRRAFSEPVLPQMIEALDSGDPVVRMYAALLVRDDAYALTSQADQENAIRSLLPLLDDKVEMARCAAIEALCRLEATPGTTELKALARTVRLDKSPRVRIRAAFAMGRAYARAEDRDGAPRAALDALAKDEDPAVRALAAFARLDTFPDDEDLRDFRATKGLSAMVPLVLEATAGERDRPLPRRGFTQNEVDVNSFFGCLGAIGPAAKSAAPFLFDELRSRGDLGGGDYRDPRNLPLVAVFSALANIFPDEAPELVKALGDESRAVRTTAAMVLATNQHPSARVIEVLIESWDHECWGRCLYVLTVRNDTSCLAQLGSHAVPALLDQLRRGRHPDEAKQALTLMSEDADKVVPLLLPVLRSKQERDHVRAAVAMALGSVGEEHEEVKKLLVATLSERREPEQVRAAAADGLRRFGARAESALGELKQAADGDSAAVRESAQAAIETIQQELELRRNSEIE